MVNGEKIVNTVISGIFVIGMSIGLTLIIMAFAPTFANFIDRFIFFYTTQGLLITITGYKVTRKYYNNKQNIKRLAFWRD